MTADAYTRPERATEVRQARKVLKRMKAKQMKCGVCCLCKFREETFGLFHCANKPGRAWGMCQSDEQAPRFEFDDSVLGEFQNAA